MFKFMKPLKELNIKIFADGADIGQMKKSYKEGIIKGFTTNPTLVSKVNVKDYESFAKSILSEITDLPISFEVLADDFEKMEYEARKISSWGNNVYVKIPITNTKAESSIPLIKKLSNEGLSLNVTAILTLEQVKSAAMALSPTGKSIISVFAGRIADTGRDPIPYMKQSVALLKCKSNIELLWASPRELLNIFQADACGCHIISVTNDILNKLPRIGQNLKDFSQETVQMFYNDAKKANLFLS